MANCYIFNTSGSRMQIDVNGRRLLIAGTKAARSYVPFSGVTCLAKYDEGKGCLVTAAENTVSLFYPDNSDPDRGPFNVLITLPRDISLLDDLILYGCGNTLFIMNKRGFVVWDPRESTREAKSHASKS